MNLAFSSLLGHPQLHDATVRFLPAEELLSLRAGSNALLLATDDFVVSEVIEYLLAGRSYRTPIEIYPYARLMRKLHLYEGNEQFQERILDVLQAEQVKDMSAEALRDLKVSLWTNMSGTLINAARPDFVRNQRETVRIFGADVDALSCLHKAHAIAPSNHRVWNNFTTLGMQSIEVDGRQYTRLELTMKAVECWPEYAIGWRNLGVLLSTPLTGFLGRPITTKKDCLLKAVEFGDGQSEWLALATSTFWNIEHVQDVLVKGAHYDRGACLREGILRSPRDPAGWRIVATLLGNKFISRVGRNDVTTVEVGGVRIDAKGACVRCLELDPKDTVCWSLLGKALDGLEPGEDGVVRISSVDPCEPIDSIRAYLKSVLLGSAYDSKAVLHRKLLQFQREKTKALRCLGRYYACLPDGELNGEMSIVVASLRDGYALVTLTSEELPPPTAPS